MREDLKKSIEQSAGEVRAAIASAKSAENAIKANQDNIDLLNEQLADALQARTELHVSLMEKNEATAKASVRYNFFMNEAVYHPY